MKKITRRSFAGSCGALGVALSCNVASAETYTMRFSVPQAANSVQGLSAIRFASAVNRRANGQLKIEVYPSGQLAKEMDSIEGLSTGVLDFTIQASGFLEPLFPRLQVFDLPFLFKDMAAGIRVLDGPIGAELFADLETKGIIGLGWGSSGFRKLETTSKVIAVPEDMKGLRMRIQSGAIYVATYQALGALPVTIDITETYTALSQHTVDGLDISLDAFTTAKFFTIVKRVAMSNHALAILPVLGSKRKIEMLPSALQRIVREEGKAVIPYMRSIAAQREGDAIETLKKNGVQFSEIQYAAFRKAMDPVYAGFQAKAGGELIDRIARAANAR